MKKVYDDYYLLVGKDKYKQLNVFSSMGVNGTEYYKLVKENSEVVLRKLESKSYTDSVFILQPINK